MNPLISNDALFLGLVASLISYGLVPSLATTELGKALSLTWSTFVVGGILIVFVVVYFDLQERMSGAAKSVRSELLKPKRKNARRIFVLDAKGEVTLDVSKKGGIMLVVGTSCHLTETKTDLMNRLELDAKVGEEEFTVKITRFFAGNDRVAYHEWSISRTGKVGDKMVTDRWTERDIPFTEVGA